MRGMHCCDYWARLWQLANERVTLVLCVAVQVTLFFTLEVSMAYRRKMSRKKSRRSFRKGATKVHRKNLQGRPMRGGIRL